jgi:hypothetical protein
MAQQKQGPKSTKPKAPAQKPISPRQAQKEAELMKKYPGGTLVRNPVPGTLQTNVGGKRIQYHPEVKVMSPKKEKDTRSQTAMPRTAPRSLQMAKVDSSRVALPKLKAPAVAPPKTMGRLRTAANDATSTVRGAYNTAFGKNQSQTTGGKILERGARLGYTALGLTATGATTAPKIIKSAVTGKASLGRNMFTKTAQSAAKSRLGSLSKYVGAAGVLAPVAIGQMEFKNRTEDSKRRGIANPGKNNSLGINFDKPFQKKTAAADSSSKSKKK